MDVHQIMLTIRSFIVTRNDFEKFIEQHFVLSACGTVYVQGRCTCRSSMSMSMYTYMFLHVCLQELEHVYEALTT